MTVEHHNQAVAIIGGAAAGSVAAATLAARGALAVVFEQNDRPFGKIEDGLPRWHVRLREAEYARIVDRLNTPGVHLLPRTAIGRDVAFDALLDDWGFSAVLLANGAWRDRPLPVPDAEAYVGRGLVYQNPFVYGFNHYHEADYAGERFEVPEGAMIIGGGLASIDVAKICMIETTRRRLAERGHDLDVEQLERKGVHKACREAGLAFSDLGIEPCTLFYRRTAADMPILTIPPDATSEQVDKARSVRVRLLENTLAKYGFRFEPTRAPQSLLVRDGRAVGVRFNQTRIAGGRVRLVEGAPPVDVEAPVIISSIGSIPAPIDGVEMDGDLYRFRDEASGIYTPRPGVFGVGNAVTGKGNIKASIKHSQRVTEQVARYYLGLDDDLPDDLPPEQAELRALYDHLDRRGPVSPDTLAGIERRVAYRQREIGYTSLGEWLASHAPK